MWIARFCYCYYYFITCLLVFFSTLAGFFLSLSLSLAIWYFHNFLMCLMVLSYIFFIVRSFFLLCLQIVVFICHKRKVVYYICILHSTKRQDQRDLLFFIQTHTYTYERSSALMWKTVLRSTRIYTSSIWLKKINIFIYSHHTHTY